MGWEQLSPLYPVKHWHSNWDLISLTSCVLICPTALWAPLSDTTFQLAGSRWR